MRATARSDGVTPHADVHDACEAHGAFDGGGGGGRRAAETPSTTSLWQRSPMQSCSMQHAMPVLKPIDRYSHHEGGALPSVEELATTLRADPAALTMLCTVYAQDYACFGYDGMCAQTLSQLDRAGALD